ncbi:MAG: type IV secretory system conjugative DNA transfer family protein [Cyanobacteria bacterium P01_H01_bin.74]
MQPREEEQGTWFPALIIGAGSGMAHRHFGPLMIGSEINWLSAATFELSVVCGFLAIPSLLSLLSDWLELVAAHTPRGIKGTSGFIKSLSELKADLIQRGWGPYWGTFKGQPVFADFEASAMTLGPSGTGKSTKVVQPMVMALKGKSKTVIDFKSELTPVLAKALRKRGEEVKVINLGNLFEKEIGQDSDEYKPLCLVADLYFKEGGLFEITDLVYELCLQLYPEPKGGKDDDKYFRDGSRRIIAAVVQICVLIEGYNATLGAFLQMLNDRQNLQKHLQWVTGRLIDESDKPIPPMPLENSPWASQHSPEDLANYSKYLQGLCAGIADMMEGTDNKTFESFITGSQEALSSFNITSLAYQKTKRSSFRFSQQKEGKKPIKVFIMLDPNKAKAQAPVLGIIQWAMLYEIKQHPNKHRPVFLIADEATNIPWSGLGSLITWARSYGLRLFFCFQTLHAWKELFGENALQVLLSEFEIIQVLAGQRNPETLKMVETKLAEQAIITENFTNNKEHGAGINSTGLSESSRPLMTADEIRRTDKTILFIRKNKPLLVDLPSISSIHPWRKQIGINPFHGKPYLQKVKLRLGSRKGPLLLRPFFWLFKGGRSS